MTIKKFLSAFDPSDSIYIKIMQYGSHVEWEGYIGDVPYIMLNMRIDGAVFTGTGSLADDDPIAKAIHFIINIKGDTF